MTRTSHAEAPRRGSSHTDLFFPRKISPTTLPDRELFDGARTVLLECPTRMVSKM